MRSLRIRYGLHWSSHLPSLSDVHLGDLAVFLTVVVGTLLVLLVDTRKELEIASASADSSSQQFADFLNGGALVAVDQSFAARCDSFIEVTK